MQSIPLASMLRWEDGEVAHEQTLVIEPLFPGYGTTIGNALRRVLLNSLPGAATVAVRIEGVDHEFSSIEHVKEDVVEILLNVKQLRLRVLGDEPTATLELDIKGERVVTAADIMANSAVSVGNPDQVIATLTSPQAHLRMEFMVEKGRGYLPTEARDSKQKLPLGTIAVDAIFTPMRSVGMVLENVRVGQITNYDKLMLKIKTDGTLTPKEAVERSMDILLEQFENVKQLLNPAVALFEEAPTLEEVSTPEESADDEVAEEETGSKRKKKSS